MRVAAGPMRARPPESAPFATHRARSFSNSADQRELVGSLEVRAARNLNAGLSLNSSDINAATQIYTPRITCDVNDVCTMSRHRPTGWRTS